MDVDVRQLAFDRAAHVEVEVPGEGGVDAALEADLDRAAFPRLAAAADDLVQRDEVRAAAQVLGELALRECAEAAAEVADVGVVDVARDDVCDGVAVDLAAEPVGRAEDDLYVWSSGAEEGRDVVLAELVLRARPRQRLGDSW